MAFSINQALLVGNVTGEPDLRFTPSGTPVLSFSIATNYSKKEGDNWVDVPTFHRIVVWGKITDYLSKNIEKGDQVTVRGRIDNRSYEDKNGNKRYISEIVADDVIPQRKKYPRETQKNESDQSENIEDVDANDIPY